MLNNELLQNMYAFCFAILAGSIIVVLITTAMHNSNSVIGTTSGYGAASVSMLVIICLAYGAASSNMTITLMGLFISMLPYFILLGLFIYAAFIVNDYSEQIGKNKITPNYNMYSYISIILMLVQVALLYGSINNNYYKQNGIISRLNAFLLIFIGIINAGLLASIGTEMGTYMTDG
jgi:hypothetical protein